MKLFLGILFLVIIFGGAYFALIGQNSGQQSTGIVQNNAVISGNQTEKTVATQTTGGQQVADISLTDQGFEPSTITIKTGTKVVWVNNLSEAATVSSDPHPIHNLFPFLNLGKFEAGQTLETVFQDKGTYTYHNHFNPSDKGTVIVE